MTKMLRRWFRKVTPFKYGHFGYLTVSILNIWGVYKKTGQSPQNFTPPPLDEDGFTVACIEEKEKK